MSEWSFFGSEKRDEMEKDLRPEYLADDLQRYQKVFGKEFGVKELLQLEDIRVKAMIVEALTNMLELLMDQVGVANNSSNFHSASRALERIADIVEERMD